jgi:2-phosphosulfolactate phosphatase
LASFAEAGSIVVIVDVLRFSTAVEACNSRGSAVYPIRWENGNTSAFESAGIDDEVSEEKHLSLSPSDLLRRPEFASIVISSPNGATCAVMAADAGALVIAACLRNAPAVADFVAKSSLPVSVVACGERWPDDSLRPALEDLLAAGAVLSLLGGNASPEAHAAITAWEGLRHGVSDVILNCESGQELIAKGHLGDVEYAAEFGVSETVPVLIDGAFRSAS